MPAQVRARPLAPTPGADRAKVVDLLGQALQCELGGAQVYAAAIRCAQASSLRAHWVASLARANERARILAEAFATLGLPVEAETPGRAAIRRLQEAAVASMEDSRTDAPLDAVQLVAADCVVAIEARTAGTWRLVRVLAKALAGERGKVLRQVCAAVDAGPLVRGETDPLAHDLWLRAIGLPPTPAAPAPPLPTRPLP